MKDKMTDLMAEITTTVMDAIENGTAPWQKPWESRANDEPANLCTGKAYRGLNALYLRLIGPMIYDCHYWLGYAQAKKLGGNVRKGEKSTTILAPMIRNVEQDGIKKSIVCGFRATRIFNAAQCDGLELPSAGTAVPDRIIDANQLDAFVERTNATVKHGGSNACYIPALDVIEMPIKNDFLSAGGYYGTLLHELTHWTGHKSRLNRIGNKTKRGYAYEELIAELGAYYASERLNCPNGAENHASYVDNWMAALQNDPKYLWSAASAAEKAADYLIKIGSVANQRAA